MSATSARAAAPASATGEVINSAEAETLNEVGTAHPTAAVTAPTAAPPTESNAGNASPEDVQQPATKPAVEAVGTAHPTEQERAIERIRQSALPPALRERLTAAVQAGASSQISVEACLAAIQQSLPDFLRGGRENVSQPAHPGGDAFFRGGDGELSDAEAEALAARQLARSGLLRGQRVKAAE